jgi:hypothetical protein
MQKVNMEIKELNIEGERVFVKKSNIFGWGFVKPYKVDGKINWKNLLIGGSWIKFGLLMLAILIFIGCVSEYSTALKAANECANTLPTIILP